MLFQYLHIHMYIFTRPVSSIRLICPSDLTGSSPKSKPPLWVFAVLATFDLSGTAIGGVGLQWVDASVNQMLRGSGVVFTAFASILLLQRRLCIKQWYAHVLICYYLFCLFFLWVFFYLLLTRVTQGRHCDCVPGPRVRGPERVSAREVLIRYA